MAEEKKQRGLFINDIEIELVKASFADNDDLIFTIRKVMYQFSLSKNEKEIVKNLKPDLLSIIKRYFIRDLNPELTVGSVGDIWSLIPLEIESKTPADALPLILSRARLVDYLKQQMSILEGKDIEEKIKFSDFTEIDGKDIQDIYCNTILRNKLISHVESQLMSLTSIAGNKDTKEMLENRAKMNSSR